MSKGVENVFDLADVLKGVPNLDTSRKQLEDIKLDLIDPDPNNFYSIDGIEELAANIQLCGLQQPIVVRPIDGGRYMVVSGHRRRAAITLLAKEEPEKWAMVSCLVERDAVSPELQQLRLIYANADTRAKSSAELAREAEQVEELLYKLKEQGFEFPGRMRDHVSAAVKASRSKLARLKMIRENLIDRFLKMWESGELRDSVAYTLAQASREEQSLIWTYQTAGGTKAFRCSDGWVQGLLREMIRMKELCGKTPCVVQRKGKCQHCNTRVQNAASLSQYSALNCRGCCFDCWNLKDCQFYCTFAADTRQVLREKARAEKRQAKAEQAAKEAPEREAIRQCYQRVGELRVARGVSEEDFVRESQDYVIQKDVERLPKLEAGTVSLNDRLPGGLWPAEARRLAAAADLLGCSIDYLLGRSDVVDPAKDVPNLGTGWQTGDPEKSGEYAVIAYDPNDQAAIQMLERWNWDGKRWLAYGTDSSAFGFQVRCWIPMPSPEGDNA